MIWFLTARASSWSRSISSRSVVLARVGSSLSRSLVGEELQVVHLAEQVGLLLAGQQGDLVEARQVRRQPLGGLGLARGPAVERRGHRAEDLGPDGRVVEGRVRHELELGGEQPAGAHLVDDAVDARPGAAELAGQDLDRDAAAEELVDLDLGVVVERAGRGREDGPVGVVAVVGLEGRADGLGGAFHLAGDPPRDLDQAPPADLRHAAGAADDLVSLFVGQLSEPGAPVHLIAVGLDEPHEARFEEPDLGPAVDDEPAGDQALPPPSGDGPGRDVEPPAHGVDRQHRLGGLLGLLTDRPGEVLDEQPEVVTDVLPVEHQRGRTLRAGSR